MKSCAPRSSRLSIGSFCSFAYSSTSRRSVWPVVGDRVFVWATMSSAVLVGAQSADAP